MQPQGYQPFLIGEGKQTTGLFTYLDSWIKPQTAYDVLVNAYVYRGSLFQRNGFSLFPSAPGAGALVYADSLQGATGNGTNARGGTIAKIPIITGNFTVQALLSNGSVETWTDPTGSGTLTGSLTDTGTVNYITGVWTISTATTGTTIANGVAIWVTFSYVPTNQGIHNPIMGIKQFINETTDTNVLLVLDTKRASWWNSATNSFTALNTFSQNLYQFDDPTALVSPPLNPVQTRWANITPYSVTVQDSAGNIMVDNGTGGFIIIANPGGGGTGFKVGGGGSSINYTTGAVTLIYLAAPVAQTLVTITGTLSGNYFTGDNTNFFNSTNWDAPDTPAFLYVTNNVDFITTFNGTTLARPAFALYKRSVSILSPSQVLLAYVNDIAKAIDVQVFQDRLLIIRPTIVAPGTTSVKSFAENQAIYFSCPQGNLSFSPTNFVLGTEIAGNGGFIAASTGDILQAEELIRDVLIVFFTNSTWILRATGNFQDPLRFYRLNVSRSTNAPYGTAPYDITASSMGAKGLIMSDGVGVERYDENIIDVFEDINNNAFGQCFAQKYDAQNQTWMLYPSEANNSSTSDQILVYNYLEETWAKFQPNLGTLASDATKPNTLSCLGLGYTTKDLIWNDFAPGGKFGPNGLTWDEANFKWDAFLEQDLTPSLLAGDQNGFVFIADDGPFDEIGPQNSAPQPIPTQVITKRLNPFINVGVKATFGYLDIYYQVNAGGSIKVNIYGNNSNLVYKTFTFTLDGNSSATYNWKRFYINITAEFIQVEFNSFLGDDINNVPQYNAAPPFKILGMLLWAQPASRLTPGTFL